MSNELQFKIGDLVKLKSGGPVMTVTSVAKDGTVYCNWFAGKKAEKWHFPPDAVTVAQASSDESKGA